MKRKGVRNAMECLGVVLVLSTDMRYGLTSIMTCWYVCESRIDVAVHFCYDLGAYRFALV